MRNITLIVTAFAVVVILTGCGHNAIQYGDGVGFDVGINPENCMLSLNLRFGKILSAVTRDNVELEMTEGEDRASDQWRDCQLGRGRSRSQQGPENAERSNSQQVILLWPGNCAFAFCRAFLSFLRNSGE